MSSDFYRYFSVKDSAALLIAGVVAAGLSWAFWRYLGEYGALIVLVVAVISLLVDNRRLRKILRENNWENKATKFWPD